jgi:hypothetical protein
LDETKADKNWIQSEFERVNFKYNLIKHIRHGANVSFFVLKKADKRDLDAKVNRKLFDDTTHDLNKSFDTCMHKHGLLVMGKFVYDNIVILYIIIFFFIGRRR